MSMRTPLGRARGLGSARGGTGHFWHQRLTAIANIPLAIALAVIVIAMGGLGYQEARDFVARPLVSLLLVLFVLSAVFHMRLGMQVIIEDYIHGEGARIAALAASTFLSVAVAVACLFALIRIGFGG